jgi:hypothetical protein
MNTMHMPGFAAEQSLHAVRGRDKQRPAGRFAVGCRHSRASEMRKLRGHSRALRDARLATPRRLRRPHSGPL